MEKKKHYRLDAYILINQDEEEQEILTLEEAQAEKEQAELMQPENIYKIVDVETGEGTD